MICDFVLDLDGTVFTSSCSHMIKNRIGLGIGTTNLYDCFHLTKALTYEEREAPNEVLKQSYESTIPSPTILACFRSEVREEGVSRSTFDHVMLTHVSQSVSSSQTR